jgi:starch-binding outer membrane protein, SusD/RagB family
MKNTISKMILIILLVSFMGCGEELLDKAPYGAISDVSFYTSESDAIQAVNSIYDQLQQFLTFNSFIMHADIWSDDTEKGAGGPGDTPQLEELNSFDIQLSNWLIEGIWNGYYSGIFRANKALEKIEEMDIPDKNRLLGEAHFLRALYYFHLNIRFHGIPLVSSTSTEELSSISRSSAEQIWEFIVQDLLEAVNLLPTSYSGSDIGRATKGSAQGLLGRVYLFMNEWQKAADVYAEVINSGIYYLIDDYAVNFGNAEGDNLPESLFEVQYTTGTGDSGNGFQMHGWIRPRDVPNLQWGGNGFSVPTQSLVDEFEPGDVRRKATVMVEGDIVFGETYHSSWSPYTGYNARKYIYGPEVIHAEADANYKMIRYSEVLIGYAEAIYRGADGAANITGTQALNLVRSRAGLPDITELTFESIVHERRVEFALEGKRFFDLVRWGIAKEILGDKFDINHDEYMPIPLNEILLNPNLEQNPGY